MTRPPRKARYRAAQRRREGMGFDAATRESLGKLLETSCWLGRRVDALRGELDAIKTLVDGIGVELIGLAWLDASSDTDPGGSA